MEVDTYREEKERRIKDTAVFLMGRGEARSPENMESLYASVQSLGMEEDYDIPFTDWKGVGEYQDSVEPTSLSANFATVFSEVAS